MAVRITPTRLLAALTLAGGALLSAQALAAKDVTFAVAIALETLDPYNTNSTLNQAAGKAYYEGLYEFDKDLKLQPKLATDYTVSPDGLVYTLKLRPGIKFHDGTDFDATAVKATFDRVSNPENKLARYTQFNRVKSTEVIDPQTVRAYLRDLPGVAEVHDLHIWAMSTTETALTCHLVIPAGHPGDPFLHDLATELARRFRIGHPTVQVETDPDVACALAPDDVV